MAKETNLEYWVRREAEERRRACETLDGVSLTHARLADGYAELVLLENILRAPGTTPPR